jgi:predicted HicB family RNase H-like nuclease
MNPNIMIINDQKAVIYYDPNIEMFRGEFLGLSGGADFYASDVETLRREGIASLTIYLEECRKSGIDPYQKEAANS